MNVEVKIRKSAPKKNYSENYTAKCPFCEKRSLLWACEVKSGQTEGTNKCAHFSGYKDRIVTFSDSFELCQDGNDLFVNGVKFKNAYTFKNLAEELSNDYFDTYESALRKLLCVSTSYAFGSSTNDRFAHLIKFIKSGGEIKQVENYTI
jgi:transcription elongation factor Elf1